LLGHGAKGSCTKKDYNEQIMKHYIANISRETQQFDGYPLLFQEDSNEFHGPDRAYCVGELEENLSIQSIENWPSSLPGFNPFEPVRRSFK
jgi:hypothetical protein